jgi:hypothetical protein
MMNEQQMFDVGDLVYIVQDCYVFMSTRARIVKMGGIGVIIQTEPPFEHLNDDLMMRFWNESVKVQVSENIIGWIQINHLEKL